jgi:CubicO group peptidase (beta-lactamase class C family)
MSTNDDPEMRRLAVATGLGPSVRIVARPVRWTIEERLEHHRCPGVSVAMLRDGEIDWVDGFGKLSADGNDACGPDTVFMVASCSKPVTAVLVLQQVERGVLDLDRDVNDYLQRWQVPSNEFTAKRPVTLRRALSHTAGLTVNGWGVVPAGAPVPTELELLEGRPPSQMPAVRVDKAHDGVDRYSGGGYLIAQMLLEDVLGVSFAELAHDELFGPLGMTRTSFARPWPLELRDDAAAGHGDDGVAHPAGTLVSAEAGAGGLHSTAVDYARFLLAVRAAWLGEPGAILGLDMVRLATTRFERGAFGLGFRVVSGGRNLRLNHGGSNDGYQTETNLYLESGDGGIVFTNATSGLFLFREVFSALAEVGEWPEFGPPPKRLAQLVPAELERYAGEYRIVSGIELPLIRTWVDDGRLLWEIPGLRFGVSEMLIDVDGALFSPGVPFETHASFGPDGRVGRLEVFENGTSILAAERIEPPSR